MQLRSPFAIDAKGGEEEEFAQAIGEERSLLKPQAATIGEPKR